MEEWLAFTETFSMFLLHDLPWKRKHLHLKKVFDEQWSLLLSSVLYFMKWHAGQHTEERLVQAQKDLLEYGRLVEQVLVILEFGMFTHICIYTFVITMTRIYTSHRDHECAMMQLELLLQACICVQIFGGKYITTFKLHLAAMHLADQVRACGPGYTWTEFWVERMVQLVKRMVKYRSTAYPELLFVHDWLLTLACRRVKLSPDGCHCVSLYEALRAVKKRRLLSRDEPLPGQAVLLGAPKTAEDGEKAQVLHIPPTSATDEDIVLQGLPQLLFEDTNLLVDGWPVFKDNAEEQRPGLILHELGLQGPLGAGKEGVEVVLKKFTRADLTTGDTVSSVQCNSQRRKNNQWFLIQYSVEHADGRKERKVYVGQFLYFVHAAFSCNMLPEGAARAGSDRHHPYDLRLGVANLYSSEDQHGPGVRPADPEMGRLHEFVKVAGLDPSRAGSTFEGVFVLDLRTIYSQVVPTRERDDTRYFCVSSKLSGRFAGVKR